MTISRVKPKKKIKVIYLCCTPYCQFGTIYISFLKSLWALKPAKIYIKCEPYIHVGCSLTLHIILPYLSISYAFYFFYLTLITPFILPFTGCPRQARKFYCLLIKCSSTGYHLLLSISIISTIGLHVHLISTVHWRFSLSSEIRKF